MRTLICLFLFATVAHAQQDKETKRLFKHTDHVVAVRIVDIDPAPAGKTTALGPVRCVVTSVYKSKDLRVGDTIAVQGQLPINTPKLSETNLMVGNQFVVFLSGDHVRSFSQNGKTFKYYSPVDDWMGWQRFTPGFDEALKVLAAGKKKKKK